MEVCRHNNLKPNQSSTAQMLLINEDGGPLGSCQCCTVWMADCTNSIRNSNTNLFALYASNGYKTSFLNYECGSFVQVSKKVTLGQPIPDNVATINMFAAKEKIEKAIGEGGSDGVVQEMISNGKSHGPSWLIGRHTKSAEVSKYAPTTSTYIQELVAKIRESIVDKFEAKVKKKVQNEFDAKVNQKVQDNLTWVLKKLGEENPDMQIDVGNLYATVVIDGTGGTRGSQI